MLNFPPDPDLGNNQAIGSDTQLNLGDGGAVGTSFDAGASDGTSTNVEVNISGGSAGDNFSAYSGSTVNLSGGTVGDRFGAFDGGMVNIFGDEFRFNGVLVDGLDAIGDMLAFDLPTPPPPSVLSGTLADGTPFAFSSHDMDDFSNGTLTLHRTALPAIGPPVIVVPTDPVPLGIREGQTVIVNEGGVVGNNFNAGRGSTTVVTGGSVGRNLELAGATLVASAGTIGNDLDAFSGSNVSISGGEVGFGFRVHDGTVNISDGSIGDFFRVHFSTVNITGGSVGETFGAVNGSTVNISGGLVADFGDAFLGSIVNISGGSVGRGFEAFETSTVNISGGSVGRSFVAMNGSIVNISGGTVGDNFDSESGSTVNISGGTVSGGFDANRNSLVNISGGMVGGSFDAFAGSVVNISGGSIGDDFDAFDGSTVNLFGTEFILDGIDITSSLTLDVPFAIDDRDVTFSGLLDDDSPFSFDLNSTNGSGDDYFDPNATLTITLTALPGDFNSDGLVNTADRLIWEAAYGAADNGMDGEDFLLWQRQFQTAATTAVSSAVPEPASGLLLLLAGIVVSVRRQTGSR